MFLLRLVLLDVRLEWLWNGRESGDEDAVAPPVSEKEDVMSGWWEGELEEEGREHDRVDAVDESSSSSSACLLIILCVTSRNTRRPLGISHDLFLSPTHLYTHLHTH